MFGVIVGLVVMLGGVGTVEVSITNTELGMGLVTSMIGIVIMMVGVSNIKSSLQQ